MSFSRSSNRSSTTNQTFDNRIAADGSAVVARSEGGDVSIYSTGEDAFSFANEVASEGFKLVGNAVQDANFLTGDSLQQALEFASSTVEKSNAQNKNALSTLSRGFDTSLSQNREDSAKLIGQFMSLGALVLGASIVFRK